jgi:tetratricopeptide (TPR) repeat protein/predicted AlkP superfamily phosphohydrolase/phosphomutase
VLLVGIDGADPQIVDRLVAAGRLPNLARLRAEGAHGPLRSHEPLLSPIVWTTIVTGRKGPDHGVLDFVEIASDGKPVPITSARRRVPALWNVLDAAGRSAGVVGWYASYPAEPVRGFVVSDRLGFHQVRSARDGGAGATYPEALAAEIRARLGEATPNLEATRARFVEPAARPSPDGEQRLARLAEIHATTELYLRVARDQRARHPTDLLAVYFELVDACSHLFMEDAPPARPGLAPEDLAAFGSTVDRCYAYQDDVLGRLLEGAPSRGVTLVVSDHGFKSGDARPVTSGRADTGLAPLWHKLNGIALAAGPGVKKGGRLEGASILDVAPTVLALLGVPASRELEGAPFRGAFEPGALREPPRIERFAPARAAPAGAAGADDATDERLERLRALGYLGGSAAPVAHDDEGRTAASYLYEGTSRAADGDDTGALAAFTRARQLDPRNANARVLAARAHLRQGDAQGAERLLDEALRLDPMGLAVHLQRAALLVETGRYSEAERELALVGRLDDRVAQLHLLRARAAHHAGRTEEALAALRRAESLSDGAPFLAETLRMQAQVAAELGQPDDAERALRQAQAIDPAPVAPALRAEVALARGDFGPAAALYREALAARPDDPNLERKLGQALAGAGDVPAAEDAFGRSLRKARTDEERAGAFGDQALLYQKLGRESDARALLLRSVERLPRSAALWGMLGAAWGREGRLDRATQAYERSVALEPTALGCKTLAALVFGERRERARAVSLWRQSLALDPDQPDVQEFLKRYDPAR